MLPNFILIWKDSFCQVEKHFNTFSTKEYVNGRKKEVIKDECKWTISVIYDFSVIVKKTSIFWFSLSFRKLQFKKELSCILLEVLFMVTLAGLFLGLYLEISCFLLFQMIQKLDKAQKSLCWHSFDVYLNIKYSAFFVSPRRLPV